MDGCSVPSCDLRLTPSSLLHLPGVFMITAVISSISCHFKAGIQQSLTFYGVIPAGLCSFLTVPEPLLGRIPRAGAEVGPQDRALLLPV